METFIKYLSYIIYFCLFNIIILTLLKYIVHRISINTIFKEYLETKKINLTEYEFETYIKKIEKLVKEQKLNPFVFFDTVEKQKERERRITFLIKKEFGSNLKNPSHIEKIKPDTEDNKYTVQIPVWYIIFFLIFLFFIIRYLVK